MVIEIIEAKTCEASNGMRGGKVEMSDTKIKMDNLAHHDIEASFYDFLHLEVFNAYEKDRAKKNISFIRNNLLEANLCLEVGCGTGFLTGFELAHFKEVIATDISRQMLRKTKSKFKNVQNLRLILCDAQNLSLKEEAVDLVSLSSVLHHLPDPHSAIREFYRVLKNGAFLYLHHEPHVFEPLPPKYIEFLNTLTGHLIEFLCKIYFEIFKRRRPIRKLPKLDYGETDIHRFSVENISQICKSNKITIVKVYPQVWLSPWSLLHKKHFLMLTNQRARYIFSILSKANFLIEKLPLSKRQGRVICVIGKKITTKL